MKHYTLSYLAQAYGDGAYGANSYSCTTQQQTAGTCTVSAGSGSSGTSNGASGSSLTNTGMAVAVLVTLACLSIFVAIIVRVWRRKPQLVAQEIETTDMANRRNQ